MSQSAYEYTTGFSNLDNDPESSHQLLSTKSRKTSDKFNSYLKPVSAVICACLVLASLSFMSAKYSKVGTIIDASILHPEGSGLESYLTETHGLQPVMAGCINLYALNPNTSPDTIAYVICNGYSKFFSSIQFIICYYYLLFRNNVPITFFR